VPPWGVEGAAMDLLGYCLSHHAAGAANHFLGCSACEGKKKDPAWVGTAFDQAGDPRCQGLGFARPRAGNDQERSREVLGSLALGWVERQQPAFRGGSPFREHGSPPLTLRIPSG